jgi:hypothetical protein
MHVVSINKRSKWRNPSKSKTYNSWTAMRSRCYRPNDKCYDLYGGRGIIVCEEWLNDYDKFFDDMGECPEKMSLDRIDSNGNYELTNCRWATMKDQQNNRRNNIILTFDGKTRTLIEWSNLLGILPGSLRTRIFVHKVPVDVALASSVLSSQKWKHGTNNGYNSGCRCLDCTAYNKIKSKKYRDKIKATGLSKEIEERYHGTRTGYELYSCRCISCKKSNRIRSQAARDKLKLKQYG